MSSNTNTQQGAPDYKRKTILEFVLRINGKIACERHFDVYDYERNFDKFNCIEDCTYLIENDLKNKAVDHLWNQFDPYTPQLQENVDKGHANKEGDEITFEINTIARFNKIDDKKVAIGTRNVAKKLIDAHGLPPEVKYNLDIRPLVPELFKTIENYATNKLETA